MSESKTISNFLVKSYESLSDKYEFGERIGRGAYADVLKAKDLTTNEIKAIKVMELVNLRRNTNDNDSNFEKIKREAELISKLNHPNIVKFYECFQQAKYMCIVCEYCEKDLTTVLLDYIDKKTHPSRELIVEWFLKLSKGLDYLHDNKIIHRDIKPSNILLKNDEIKITDFGESKQLLKTLSVSSVVHGTPEYISPEIFNEETFTYKTDVWSLGCVFYEIYYLEQAFSGKDFTEVKKNVLNRRFNHVHDDNNAITIIIYKMICVDKNERPSVKDILKYQLFTYVINDTIEPNAPSKIKAYGPGLANFIVNQPTEFVIDTHGAGKGKLNLTIEGPSTVDFEVKDNRDETFQVNYLVKKVGTYTIRMLFDGQQIPNSPFHVNVTDIKNNLSVPESQFKINAASNDDASRIKVYGSGLEGGITNQPCCFSMDTKDCNQHDLGCLTLAIEGPSEAKMLCKRNENNVCVIEYLPTKAGLYDLTIKYAGKHVSGSPFKVTIKDKD